MNKSLLIVPAMVMLSGCAPYLRNGYWVKPEGSYEQFSKDYVECRREATVPAAVIPKLQKDLANCMKDRGYEWEVHAGGSLITDSTLFHTKGGYNSQQKAQQPSHVESTPSETTRPEKPITSAPTTFSSGTTKILTWDFATVKSAPGSNYSSIATARKGDKLTIMEQSGEWVRVRLENGQEGWVRSEVFE